MLLTLLRLNLGASTGAGTLYAVVGPSVGWVDPTDAEIIAGTLSGGGTPTWLDNVPAPSITTDPFDWPTDTTGLTPGVFYRAAAVWTDGVTISNVEISDPWQATAAGDLAADAVAQASATAALTTGITLCPQVPTRQCGGQMVRA